MFAYVIELLWCKLRVCDLIANGMDPDQTAQIRLLRSSLIRVHSVILHDKICLGES